MSDNQHIANAVERWSDELIDIGGRNRLLFYKSLRSGTIDFRPNEGADQLVVEQLLTGDSVRLSEAVPDDENIMRRGRAIRQKSREHEEEQGIRTLYLGRYLASWSDKPGREPAAPIFLSAVEIKALGRLGDDFELARVDEWELNPSLLHYLRTVFQAEFDEDSLQQAVDDERWDHALALFRQAATAVAELQITDRVVLATFSYAKLPMVRDLENAHEAIGEHQLVAALTGDPIARSKLRIAPTDSFGDGNGQIADDPPPQDEFLILDADGSQSRVVNAALQGRNLVVVGPPGTGKSQTIANLIATLTARGKSTLFVAEKRAAIDAVTKRLKNAGLEDLVLDLHEGVRSRKQTAEQLAKALETAKYSAEPRVQTTQRRLSKSRTALTQLSRALHRKREPWGVSILDLYSRRAQLAEVEPVPVALKNRRRLFDFKPAALERLGEELEEYITTGGALLDRDQQHGWAKAHRDRTIKTTKTLAEVNGALGDLLGGELDDLEDMLQDVCGRAGIQSPRTFADARGMLTALKSFCQAKTECASQLGIDTVSTVDELNRLTSVMSAFEQCIESIVERTNSSPRSLGQVQETLDASTEYERTRDALSEELGIAPPESFEAAVALLDMLDQFDDALEHVHRSVFDSDLEALYRDLQPVSRSFVSRLVTSVLNSSYRRARAEIHSLALVPDSDPLQLRAAVDRARSGVLHWRALAGLAPVPDSWGQRPVFEAVFRHTRKLLGNASGHLEVKHRDLIANAAEQLRALGVSESAALLRDGHLQWSLLARPWQELRPSPSAVITKHDGDQLEARLDAVHSKVRLLARHVEFDDVEHIEFHHISETLNRLSTERVLLRRLPRLDGLRQSFTALGLKRFVQLAVEEEWDAQSVRRSLTRAWIEGVLAEIEASDETIATFDAARHTDAELDFCNADREHIAQGADRVRRAWAEGVIGARNAHPEQGETIVHQSKLKRKHMPMRRLVRSAADVLTALKPCWAMSPLLVPQTLPRKQLFDVVIFDEASQILPADAVSSLLRGRQAVIAGDPKQLPPTTFFTSTSDDYEEEEEDDDAADFETRPLTNDVESVLDAVSTLMPANSWTLSWHYRSLDERLIAFSNHQIYDGSLTTFPGLMPSDCVAHVEVPFGLDAIARGGSNSAEVRQVVNLILEHAERRPNESLGVIAFGLRHAHRIEEFLRLARKERPELDEFFSEERDEPLFVKNLERVQGDERDAIILTVGYGRSEDGRMRYNFGPLNREGGYRRLNVAVTRAKRRMTIVSAFSAADMDPDRLRSEGPQMLRDYIVYAASAGNDLGSARRDAEPLNPFEIDIKRRLEARGIPLQTQYGVSGYRIDFAAMHPDQLGRPVLAIEADGASYHSAINARERDRLRQEHLERLGWRFHRIWSTEWFRHPEQEVEKAVRAWREAVAEADRREVEEFRAPESATLPETVAAPLAASTPQRQGECPHVVPGQAIIDYRSYQLDDIVRWARSDGLLHTDDELIRTIARAMGYQRLGTRIRGLLQAAIARVDRRDSQTEL